MRCLLGCSLKGSSAALSSCLEVARGSCQPTSPHQQESISTRESLWVPSQKSSIVGRPADVCFFFRFISQSKNFPTFHKKFSRVATRTFSRHNQSDEFPFSSTSKF